MKRFQRLTYFNGQWLYMKSNIRKKINLFDFTVENLGFFQPHEKFSDFRNISTKQGYALKKWVEGLSDEAFYSWESPKKIRHKSVNPTFATKQKKVSIHR